MSIKQALSLSPQKLGIKEVGSEVAIFGGARRQRLVCLARGKVEHSLVSRDKVERFIVLCHEVMP